MAVLKSILVLMLCLIVLPPIQGQDNVERLDETDQVATDDVVEGASVAQPCDENTPTIIKVLPPVTYSPAVIKANDLVTIRFNIIADDPSIILENLEVATSLTPENEVPEPLTDESYVPLCDDDRAVCNLDPTGFPVNLFADFPSDAQPGNYVFRAQFRDVDTDFDLGCVKVILMVV